MELQKLYEALERRVDLYTEPDEDIKEPNHDEILALASLGIERAFKEKETIRLERDVVNLEQNTSILPSQAAKYHHSELNQRLFSAGDDLWRNRKKKMRLEDSRKIRLNADGKSMPKCLLGVYAKFHGLDNKKKTLSSKCHKDVLHHYAAGSEYDYGDVKEDVWCHVTGK